MNKSQYYLSQCADARRARCALLLELSWAERPTSTIIVSRYRCTQRCMPSSMLLACLHHSSCRFKGMCKASVPENHSKDCQNRNRKGQANRDTTKSRRREGDRPRFSSRTSEDPQVVALAVDDGYAESNRTSPSSSSLADRCCASISTSVVRSGKSSWDARRRDSKVNGADIYVARFTKNGGMGNAKPCWRCLEWSRWAGIKRILYWNNEAGKFDVVKVNGANNGLYETQADIRLFSGLGL
ncbi:hypothetical protein ABKN59_004454 [Abortiporus biennis]